MKCKDCLHFDACEGSNGTFDDEYVKDTAFSEDVRDLCPTFKNKDDYVKVVKCKECRNFKSIDGATCCTRYGIAVKGDCFCSQAERRDTK